jgi:hypothetical protein
MSNTPKEIIGQQKKYGVVMFRKKIVGGNGYEKR